MILPWAVRIVLIIAHIGAVLVFVYAYNTDTDSRFLPRMALIYPFVVAFSLMDVWAVIRRRFRTGRT
ncbi:hypothetical protein [Jannaschia sp. R86511]|uniref:hypothetical protein n=1 Tax=Jannaschia sp. R86511 TaxID=3093853 RepID=UPI0036D32F34